MAGGSWKLEYRREALTLFVLATATSSSHYCHRTICQQFLNRHAQVHICPRLSWGPRAHTHLLVSAGKKLNRQSIVQLYLVCVSQAECQCRWRSVRRKKVGTNKNVRTRKVKSKTDADAIPSRRYGRTEGFFVSLCFSFLFYSLFCIFFSPKEAERRKKNNEIKAKCEFIFVCKRRR